ncbi:MAG: protein kinase [Gammaproteobacteria bacterium]|nr:protein kinase [Gammaproteobacteria bacterium]MDH3508288.1 protein kinase [Gammaproteobacteria bacterium]
MRFLIIDDDAEYRRVLRYHLEVEWPEAMIQDYQPSSAGPLTQAFPLTDLDLILLGHPLQNEGDLALLRAMRSRAGCPPVIVFAADGDEFLAVDAMKFGAGDYFPKSRVTHQRLVHAVRALLDSAAPDGALSGSARSEGFALNGLRKHSFIAELHSGDLSSVYLAQEDGTSERRVFKVLKHMPDKSGSHLFDRFLQEYEIIANIDHPNVVKIYDLGIADDHAFIAMEYLAGGSLAKRLRRVLGQAEALDYARQIALALGAIHDVGVLHRDLKPANVMFRGDDTVALIDFGLAKQMRLEAAITGTGQIFGTPYYMSPEQGHAEAVDERSDIYSLGCILYEMLTGKRPFVADSPMAVIYQHTHAPRPVLIDAFTTIQPLLDKMLAVDPDERFQSTADLVDAFDADTIAAARA